MKRLIRRHLISTFDALKIGGLVMGVMKEFVINFGNLTLGEHEFEFKVDKTFFQHFEESPVHEGNLDVLVVLEKKESMILLDFTIQGELTITCDRCLEDLSLEMESFNEMIVKFGDVKSEEEVADDVVMLPSKEREIDVSKYIYEYITLLIPMRNVHEDEHGNPSCDPDILKELEKHGTTPEGEQAVDPRWEILKKINLN